MESPTKTVNKKYIKAHLSTKRAELVWALSQQDYNTEELGAIFGLTRQRIFDIIKTMPEGWKSPWMKNI